MTSAATFADQIFVIGDSHIGLADGNESRVNAWLDRLRALHPRALYLNGDLFHYLIAHPNFRTSSVEKVLAKFRELRDSGIAIHYVEGNRDFFLKGSFVEDAVTDIALEYAIPAGDHRYLIVHGDGINDRDWKYRFWRRASKNPLTKLGVKLIPKRTARKFVDDVERRLSTSNFKHKSRIPAEVMRDYASRRAREGYTDVVFGHFHQKLELDGAAKVTVLPAWYESGEAMVIDPNTGAATFAIV
ncbi:MAG: UDP-2,3-diacylglucosamine diphosphatase [Acidobacteria bacterium]|nr:UDP-2,3-diacylglucosamine diphosphatase [Acidobacteriota bacterium]MBV9475211.1 UDP-2,3-diacylglucosamine diphosphatase [Acidobacteriota bacterium]